tara:strand:+ start:637 stop:978 length:342 start_codon:yes stop_codon:yes gene_type:complete
MQVMTQYTTAAPNEVLRYFDVSIIADHGDATEPWQIKFFKSETGTPISCYSLTSFIETRGELDLHSGLQEFQLNIYQMIELKAFIYGWINARWGSYAEYKKMLEVYETQGGSK